MKKIFLIILSTIAISYAQDMKNKPGMKTSESKQKDSIYYTCPMHPEIHSAKPGNCPKCGMKLIQKTIASPKKISETKTEIKRAIAKDSLMQQTKIEGMKMDSMPKANKPIFKTIVNNEPPKTVRYDLFIADTIVNFAGQPKRAIAANGQIPMPTLTFTEGDTAEIYVHNMMNEETSIHWHGLFTKSI